MEDALYSHPAVLEAAVVGIPHERWVETPHAVVVLKPGVTATEEELINHCKSKVGSYKKPTSVEFMEGELPKNPAGKIARRTIRERYWAGRERKVV